MSGSALRDRVPSGGRFSVAEQAIAVWLAHSSILVGVTLTVQIGLGHLPPALFFVAEGAIWIMLAALTMRYDALVEFVGRFFPIVRRRLADSLATWQRRGAIAAFGLTFVLQFVALTALLLETGGPIASPFAPLVLAFAILPMLLANKVRTICIAVFTTIAYYAAVVAIEGSGDTGDYAEPGVFVAVMTLIVMSATGLALIDRADRDRRRLYTSSPDQS